MTELLAAFANGVRKACLIMLSMYKISKTYNERDLEQDKGSTLIQSLTLTLHDLL